MQNCTKTNPFKIFLPILILFLSCTNNQSQKKFERLEIWEEIRMAAKVKRIDYLLEISDTKEYLVYSEKYEDKSGFSKRYRINYLLCGKGYCIISLEIGIC